MLTTSLIPLLLVCQSFAMRSKFGMSQSVIRVFDSISDVAVDIYTSLKPLVEDYMVAKRRTGDVRQDEHLLLATQHQVVCLCGKFPVERPIRMVGLGNLQRVVRP